MDGWMDGWIWVFGSGLVDSQEVRHRDSHASWTRRGQQLVF